jgi:hypothetical protein
MPKTFLNKKSFGNSKILRSFKCQKKKFQKPKIYLRTTNCKAQFRRVHPIPIDSIRLRFLVASGLGTALSFVISFPTGCLKRLGHFFLGAAEPSDDFFGCLSRVKNDVKRKVEYLWA